MPLPEFKIDPEAAHQMREIVELWDQVPPQLRLKTLELFYSQGYVQGGMIVANGVSEHLSLGLSGTQPPG